MRGNTSLSIYEDTLAEQLKEKQQLLDLSLSLKHLNQTYHLENHIAYFTTLTTLDISGQSLGCVPPQLAMLQRLRHLSLSFNKIGAVPEILPMSLSRLKQLCVRGNQLQTLPSSLFKCRYLIDIDASENRISELPTTFQLLSRLQILSLKSNKLKRLPPEFNSLSRLQSLDISKNDLNWVSVGFFSCLTKLEKLCISYNKLISIPHEIQRMRSIQKLELEANCLTKLPPSLYRKCTTLRELNIAKNSISEISPFVGNLLHLKTFNFSYNKIKSLPNEMAYCISLQHVIGSSNVIDVIPLPLTYCKNIQSLHLRANLIKTVPYGLARMWNLKALDLIDNDIVQLPLTLVRLNNRLTPLFSRPRPVSAPSQKELQATQRDTYGDSEQHQKRIETIIDQCSSDPILNYQEQHQSVAALQLNSEKLVLNGPINYHNVIIAGSTPSTKLIASQLGRKWGNNQANIPPAATTHLQKCFFQITDKKKKVTKELLINLWFLSNPRLHLLPFSLCSITIVIQADGLAWKQQLVDWIEFFLHHRKWNDPTHFLILGTTQGPKNKAAKDYFITVVKSIKQQYGSEKIKFIGHKYIANDAQPNIVKPTKLLESLIEDIQEDRPYQLPVSHLLLARTLSEHNSQLFLPVIDQFAMSHIGSLCGFNSSSALQAACQTLLDASIIFFRNEVYVLDVCWLCGFLDEFSNSSVVSDCGIINHQQLPILWAQYDPKYYPTFNSLLLAFDISTQLSFSQFESDEHGNLKNSSQVVLGKAPLISIVPNRVVVKITPELLASFWNPKNDNKFQYSRLYIFDSFCMSMFHIYILMILKKFDLICVWRTGIIVSCGRGETKLKLKVEILHNPQTSRTSVSFSVRSNSADRCSLGIELTIQTFEELLSEYPYLKTTRLVPPPLMEVDDALNAIPQPEIEEAILTNSLTLDLGSAKVHVADIAPDLYLYEFSGPRLQIASDISKEGLFDKTPVANIYRAKWKKKSILVKEFTNSDNNIGIWGKHRNEIAHHWLFNKSKSIVKPVCLCFSPLSLVFEDNDTHTLRTLLEDRSIRLPFSFALHIAKHIASAIADIHAADPAYVHCDIRAENVWIENFASIALKGDGSLVNPKLTNFWSSRMIGSNAFNGRYCTTNYVAPEVLLGNKWGQKVDIYAFGILCWEIVTRMVYCNDVPFQAEIEAVIVNEDPEIPEFCPIQFKQLIEACTEKNQLQRPTIQDVVQRLKLMSTGHKQVKKRHSGDSFSTKWKQFEVKETEMAVAQGNSKHQFVRSKVSVQQSPSMAKVALELGVPSHHWSAFSRLVEERGQTHLLNYYAHVLNYKSLKPQQYLQSAQQIASTYFGFRSTEKPLIQLPRDDRKELFKSLRTPTLYTFDSVSLLLKSELLEIVGVLEDAGVVLEQPSLSSQLSSINLAATIQSKEAENIGIRKPDLIQDNSSPLRKHSSLPPGKMNVKSLSGRSLISPRFYPENS